MASRWDSFDESSHGMFVESRCHARNADGGQMWTLELIAYGDNTPPDATGGEAQFRVRRHDGDWKDWRPCPSLPGGQGFVVAIVGNIPHNADIDIQFQSGEDDGYVYEVTNYIYPPDGGINWVPPPPAILGSTIINLGQITENSAIEVLIDIQSKT